MSYHLDRVFDSWEPGDRAMFVPSILDTEASNEASSMYRRAVLEVLSCPKDCYCHRMLPHQRGYRQHREFRESEYLDDLDHLSEKDRFPCYDFIPL
jgi:hypothetical protein